jgi:alpha-galactosidase
VCFFNEGDKPLQMKVNWSNLWFLKGTYKIRDLWQKKDIGTTQKGFTGDIAPHDVILFKLSPAK